jgi:hypothetical protein
MIAANSQQAANDAAKLVTVVYEEWKHGDLPKPMQFQERCIFFYKFLKINFLRMFKILTNIIAKEFSYLNPTASFPNLNFN